MQRWEGAKRKVDMWKCTVEKGMGKAKKDCRGNE